MKEKRIHPKARTEGSQGFTKRFRCLFCKKCYFFKNLPSTTVTQGDPASLRSRLCSATTLRKDSTARLRAPLRMTRRNGHCGRRPMGFFDLLERVCRQISLRSNVNIRKRIFRRRPLRFLIEFLSLCAFNLFRFRTPHPPHIRSAPVSLRLGHALRSNITLAPLRYPLGKAFSREFAP